MSFNLFPCNFLIHWCDWFAAAFRGVSTANIFTLLLALTHPRPHAFLFSHVFLIQADISSEFGFILGMGEGWE